MKNKKIKTLLIIVSCLIGIPICGFLIISWIILPSKKLTPLVVNFANEYLDANLTCERIELTYFETYPYLGVALENGVLTSIVATDSISSQILANKPDTLVSFEQCVVSLNPLAYLYKQTIAIRDIYIDRPKIYGYINKEGKANWEIVAPSDTITAATDSSETAIPSFSIERMRIREGAVTFYNSVQEVYTKVEGFNFNLNGIVNQSNNEIKLQMGWKGFQFYSEAYSLENELRLNIESDFVISENMKRITLSKAEMSVNELPFNLSGNIFHNETQNQLNIDLVYGLQVPDLNSLLAFIPSSAIQEFGVKAQGSISLDGAIKGILSDSIYPKVTACCVLENGALQGKAPDQEIKKLEFDVDLALDMKNSDSSFIALDKFYIEGNLSSFTMSGRIKDLIDNPHVNAQLKGNINFTELSSMLIPSDTLSMIGDVLVDLNTQFSINDLLQANYGKVKAAGELSIQDFKIKSDPYSINILISKASMKLDSQHKMGTESKKDKYLNGTFSIDSLSLNWKEHLLTKLSHFEMSLSAPPTLDTTAIIPLNASLQFSHLRTLMPDSAWVWSGKTTMSSTIRPSAKNKKRAVIHSIISMDSLAYLYPQYNSALLLTGSEFTMDAFPFQKDTALTNKRKATLDKKRSPQIEDKRSAESLLSESTSDLLREWDVNGSVVFKKLDASTPVFPIPMKMNATKMQFTTNDVTLRDAQLILGNSDLTLSGELKSLRNAMLHGRKLNGTFDLNSNYLDCNQLMSALTSGMLYAEANEQKQLNRAIAANDTLSINDSFVDFSSATALVDASMVEESSDTTGVFIVPKFLNLTLHTNAKKIDFKDLKLENVTGEVVLRNQSIQLTDLSMHSNMGNAELTMNYTAKDKHAASTGFDLMLQDIQVDGLMGLFPAIDTLMPMMRSFKGVVDCQIAATSKIDSTFSLVLPSLNAACYVRGKDMVLMDGETFAEISKTLMFKNKKENHVNNIAVDLIVKDNKIEVFPFLIEIDRYRVAVGGTHNLDMTYDYHISVLKSPVPFKLGVDVTGNLDDFKYKITKCKYKDIFKPAKSNEIDSTALNIRETVYNNIKHEVEAAMRAK